MRSLKTFSAGLMSVSYICSTLQHHDRQNREEKVLRIT